MADLAVLTDIVIVLALSVAVVFVCHLVRIPAIVGFILTGVLAGPSVLGLVENANHVELLAEIGVVLLLFTIGIEFSLRSLWQMGRSVLLGGGLQVSLTMAAAFLAARAGGIQLNSSIFIAVLIALSSTAIVFRLLQERSEVDSPQGRTAAAFSIFQDILVVPAMLLTPVLAGTGALTDGLGSPSLNDLLFKIAGVLLLLFVGSRWIVPRILYYIALTKSRELFLMSVVVLCFAIAWLTSMLGLSLAIGAFVAGLIISESEYSQQALSLILPFRDVFTSFFFVAIGMLLNSFYFLEHIGMILGVSAAVVVGKTILVASSAIIIGMPLRTSIIAGLLMSQVGEFSFLLSETGTRYGLLSVEHYQMFLSVSLVTMAATPFAMHLATPVGNALARLKIFRQLLRRELRRDSFREKLQDHLIIVGFGVNGRNIAKAARTAEIPYIVIELNAETARRERKHGEHIMYGDSTEEAVLEHAWISSARVLVIAVSDPAATRRIVHVARRHNPGIHIIARTRYVQEMQPLYDLGADEVIPEEFETSVEILTRLLVRYLMPREDIEKLTEEIRRDGYRIFRRPDWRGDSPTLSFPRRLPDIDISTITLSRTCAFIGQTIAESNLRRDHGLIVLVHNRNGIDSPLPEPSTVLQQNDVLVVMGKHADIAKAGKKLFQRA
ncbi:MAG: cation:proton antiporter [Candidatus Zixiibacteriota bacterium]